MEQTLVKDTRGGARVLPSHSVDCYSCKCIRHCLPVGCTGEPRGPLRRGRHRSHVGFWRPWLLTSSRPDPSEARRTQSLPYAFSQCENPEAQQKPAEYNHPVRLFWPKSKSFDHMYREAADLLNNFPVQATISFYDDSDSDSDSEEESSEEEHDSGFESE